MPIALAIEGHHTGLQQGLKSAFHKLNPAAQRLAEDGLRLPQELGEAPPAPPDPIASMVDARMMFSALTDADFVAV